MTVVAIISEYNPFHSGHKYQIDKIRAEFGDDTAIIAIMSGNYTQRGEAAIIPKDYRSKAAILSGVNLVLELPFPFSSSSAEIFAKSGVKIAESIGIVDRLSFGSESGDIESIIKATEVIDSKEYTEAFKSLSEKKELGYPKRCGIAFGMSGGNGNFSFTPNNILAIEYVRAIKYFDSKIIPHTIKRYGADYLNDESNLTEGHQSAMAIRKCINDGTKDYYDFIPEHTHTIIEDAIKNGDAPTDIEKLSYAIISNFRLNSPQPQKEYHDAGDGLYNRLYNLSFKANNLKTLLMQSDSKTYTQARLRRAILNCYFGVTSSDVKSLPSYTRVLGMDNVGMQLLKLMRKKSKIPILSKHSDSKMLNNEQLRIKDISDRADSVFELTKPSPKSGNSHMTFTPFVKK